MITFQKVKFPINSFCFWRDYFCIYANLCSMTTWKEGIRWYCMGSCEATVGMAYVSLGLLVLSPLQSMMLGDPWISSSCRDEDLIWLSSSCRYFFGESIRLRGPYFFLESIHHNFLASQIHGKAEVVMGLIMMLLVNHIIACLWYGIGSWSLGGWTVETDQSETVGHFFGVKFRLGWGWVKLVCQMFVFWIHDTFGFELLTFCFFAV